jgi:intein/homing endonuclease
MPKICYTPKKFKSASLGIIEQADLIIAEYAAQGFDLTLRQLYYQYVARDLIPNSQKSYKRLGSIINDARMAGLIDWNTIIDRTRNLRKLPHWSDPADIVESCAAQFAVDKWEGQEYRPECFDPTTPVLTPEGFIDIGSVQVGDLVLTHTGSWKHVTKVIRTPFEGTMYRIRAAGVLPFLVTPNHPFYVRPYDTSRPGKGAERKFNDVKWSPTQDLKTHDRLLLPFRKNPMSDLRAVSLQSSARSKRVEVTLDRTCMKVLGLYVAEGNIRGDGRTVQFTFGEHEPHHAELVEYWAHSLGVNTHRAPGAETLTVYAFSKSLSDWLHKEFGNGVYNKRVPSWLLDFLPTDSLPFLEYYFRGDGCFWDESRGAIAATTRSRNLALLVQIMLLERGYETSVDEMEDAGAPRYRISVGGAAADRLAKLWGVVIPEKGMGRSRRYNHIKISDTFSEFPVQKVEEVPYCGDVVNLEVEDDHSYCVPVIAHNCWIEKDALIGVIARVCQELDVPYFSCRGYTSQSEMWSAAQRLLGYARDGQRPMIIHLGDHDPSGIDMSRDISDRIELFMTYHGLDPASVKRIALNMNQVEEYDPPPNPAKFTDSRASGYVAQYGTSSWELDALEPMVMATLIREEVYDVRDEALWAVKVEEEQLSRDQLRKVAMNWDEILDAL